MRLTLRTMLAYMDNLLPAADAEELRRKIELNEGASSIMHRVRDVMSRLRLAAPKVEGRGLGADANTVAEYLDNTLPAERIPDFERVCLESDVHLAEVGACHHVLALVLGERAEVDPEIRRRMYGLIHQPLPPTEAPPVAAPPVAEADTPSQSRRRRRRSVPEYLRDEGPSRRGWKVALAVVAAGALIAVAALVAVGPERLAGLLKGTSGDANGEHIAAADSQTDDDANHRGPTDQTDEAGSQNVRDDVASTPPVEAAETGDANAELNEESISQPEVTAPPADDTSAAESHVDAAPAPPSPDETSASAEPTPTEDAETVTTAEAPTAAPPTTETSSSPTPPAAPPEGIARCYLERDVLLVFDAAEGVWKRMQHGDTVYPGDRLLSLPRFSPTVTLSTGVAVEMLGATQLTVEVDPAGGPPTLRIDYGRMILMPISEPLQPLRLVVDNQERTIEFTDGKSLLAIEVRRELIDGSDPELTPGRLDVDLYLANGRLSWKSATDAAAEITAPMRWNFDQAAPMSGVTTAEEPSWIVDERRSTSESPAVPMVEQNVAYDRPVAVTLKELAAHPRRRELRSLAAKCLALIGEYEPYLAVLRDPDQKSAWDGQIQDLRAGMARSPEDAAKVRAALEKDRGASAPALYRLLWGYTEDQFSQGGAAQELLANLDQDDLDARVLSYWNLRHSSGLLWPYDPTGEGVRRRDQIENWQKKIAALLKEKAGG